MCKVVKLDKAQGRIIFNTGAYLTYYHEQECCEEHYLDFSYLTLDDFKGLKFNLTGNNFFKRIKGYGIELVPINGHSIKIPGYGSNNGYYTENLSLVLIDGRNKRYFEIDDCQVVGA